MKHKESANLIPLEDVTKNFKKDEFYCQILSLQDPIITNKNLKNFSRELEDLMRKYKIVQSVGHIFASL